ncbi:hypothetical protein J1N35_000918, partial [Gossypium stocksii]
ISFSLFCKEQLKEFVVKALDSNVKVIKMVFNSIADKLIVRDDALDVVVSTLKEHIEELKRGLIICKTYWVMGCWLRHQSL